RLPKRQLSSAGDVAPRMWEFSALLTRIRALREIQGLQATREIEAALAEADALLEMSGAKSYEPYLHVERAELARLTSDDAVRARELREAHRSRRSARRSALPRSRKSSDRPPPHDVRQKPT